MTGAHFDGDQPVVSAHRPDHAQHASHLRLISRDVDSTTTANVDVIVVPTAREATILHDAFQLAQELACELVVLCSRDAKAHEAESLAQQYDVKLTAVNVHPPSAPVTLTTRDYLAGLPFARNSDTSLKRNLALALSRMVGWRHVLFQDDDVAITDAAQVRSAAALLDRYDAVGLNNVGFFDNSVVCHANRDTGGTQGYFVGAGGLLINAARTDSFFPDVYNEDWFFLLEDDGLIDVAMSGTCAQREFNPYLRTDRPRQEEFGDCLAEGLFSLLDDGLSIKGADHAFWRSFLDRRFELINTIQDRLAADPPANAALMRTALRTSQQTLRQITPEHCVEFLTKWRQDRETWRRYLAGLPRGRRIEDALTHLGLQA